MRLGLDVGGTKCAAVVGTAEGEVIERVQWPSAADRGPDSMIDRLVRAARGFMDRHAGVASVGVSIGGPLDAEAGVIHAPPNLPGWDAIPLRARLTDALGLPVRVMHDAAACALAEARWGVGRGLDQPVTLAFLTCGTGMGAGLVLRGEAWVGAGGRSPELGHVRLTDGPDDPEAFGKRGCVEAWCAGAGLPGVAAAAAPARWGPGGTQPAPAGPALSALAAAGDADALATLALHARMTGRTAAILGDLLVPGAIVLGSLAPRLGERWIGQVRAAFAAEVLPAVADRCRVVPAALGDRLQDLAALAAAG
ncbi:ROK family protein [Phycisphaera mikurensis]|uniref:Putative glucokinase n=1 Tax=Phycisphaera mikurensis (strain NBRC 102666 / KCTC 22515 / FYK2301M01) TaxID=1142394 RepID=I0IIB9_PHYMF|nr:ROK family protein [Phycisphaera mikurensis]MBB6442430.1 glucokinase [Phycisphaera mikurensis]BAM05007.1 putative glucokinase [Phycisphaera mikurensis NBRC 102666]